MAKSELRFTIYHPHGPIFSGHIYKIPVIQSERIFPCGTCFSVPGRVYIFALCIILVEQVFCIRIFTSGSQVQHTKVAGGIAKCKHGYLADVRVDVHSFSIIVVFWEKNALADHKHCFFIGRSVDGCQYLVPTQPASSIQHQKYS